MADIVTPIVQATTPSKAAVSEVKSPITESGSSNSFYLLLLILAIAAGAYGVWRLGGIEKTKMQFRQLLFEVKDRIQGRGGPGYGRV